MKCTVPSLLDEVRKSTLTFESGTYEYRNGALYFDSLEPRACSQCAAEAEVRDTSVTGKRKRFHRHGWYDRGLLTIVDGELREETLWNLRWLCTLCEHTMSATPPGILRRRQACVLVIVMLLWIYVNSPDGVERCDFDKLEAAAERKRVFRALRDAKATFLDTQQSMREAMLEKIKPEAWEELTHSGLSPPASNGKCQNPQTREVWETLSLLMRGAVFSGNPLHTLLARAHERSLNSGRPFLTTIHHR